MAQTVAFLFPPGSEAAADFDRLAGAAGYIVMRGVDRGDPEVVEGIKGFCRFEPEPLEVCYLVSDPANRDAFSIYKDVQFASSKPEAPPFFRFVEGLGRLPAGLPKYMIACTEWAEGDEALWFEGTTADLIVYLKVANTLGSMLWSPVTGTLQDSDRYPIIFRLLPAG